VNNKAINVGAKIVTITPSSVKAFQPCLSSLHLKKYISWQTAKKIAKGIASKYNFLPIITKYLVGDH